MVRTSLSLDQQILSSIALLQLDMLLSLRFLKGIFQRSYQSQWLKILKKAVKRENSISLIAYWIQNKQWSRWLRLVKKSKFLRPMLKSRNSCIWSLCSSLSKSWSWPNKRNQLNNLAMGVQINQIRVALGGKVYQALSILETFKFRIIFED